MADITAARVKELRDLTGLGMMDCKKALDEADGDIDAAKDILRSKGLAIAEKKAGRETKEGLIGLKIAEDGTAGAMVEIQCETDFCARNQEFKDMVESLVSAAFDASTGPVDPDDAMQNALQDTLAKIGENMSYARGIKIEAAHVGGYLHHNSKVGVLVGIDGALDDETLKGLCQHIAFSNPLGITPDDIPADVVEKERQFARQEALDTGKPADIVEKIVEGKIKKYIAGLALLEQDYVKDDKKKVREVIGDASVVEFARFGIGEG